MKKGCKYSELWYNGFSDRGYTTNEWLYDYRE